VTTARGLEGPTIEVVQLIVVGNLVADKLENGQTGLGNKEEVETMGGVLVEKVWGTRVLIIPTVNKYFAMNASSVDHSNTPPGSQTEF
jgi:hypothetical protein